MRRHRNPQCGEKLYWERKKKILLSDVFIKKKKRTPNHNVFPAEKQLCG